MSNKEQVDIIINLIKAKNTVCIEDFRALIHCYPEIMPSLRAMINSDTQGVYKFVKHGGLDAYSLCMLYKQCSYNEGYSAFNELKTGILNEIKPLLDFFNKLAIKLGF